MDVVRSLIHSQYVWDFVINNTGAKKKDHDKWKGKKQFLKTLP